MRLTIKLTVLSVLFLFLLAGAHQAQAADEGFCKRYARIAVDVQKKQKKLGCGYWGTAWHTNYNTHYNWCRRQSKKTAWSHHAWRSKKYNECVAKRSSGTSCVCRPGGNMRAELYVSTTTVEFTLFFKKANHTAAQRLPAPGYCALVRGRWRHSSDFIRSYFNPRKNPYFGLQMELMRGRWNLKKYDNVAPTVKRVLDAIKANRNFTINIYYDGTRDHNVYRFADLRYR